MKLFVSYSSAHNELCERLRLALEAEGHKVFADRAELKEGQPYNRALREAVNAADAFIFLVSPRSVAPGSYTLTELDLAQRRWRRPGGHVLPVIVEPTPLDSIPAYLRSVTFLQPKGDVVAETVAAVARMRSGPGVKWWATTALVLIFAAIGGWFYAQQQEQELRQRGLLHTKLRAATQLCNAGSHAVGWEQFTQIVARHPLDDAARTAREDCGMLWLRLMRIASDKETFGALVSKIQPALAQGLAGASGQRAADLRAHLGWADFLRSRDGVAVPDPAAQYQAALQDDAANVYAHAMWAHNVVRKQAALSDEARQHFDDAVRSGRDRPFARGLQFASVLSRPALAPYAMQVANAMRVNGEPLETEQRERIWRYAINGPFLDAGEQAAMLAALPPAQHLATFEWLFPAANVAAERKALWRLCRALLQAHAGNTATARADMQALQREQRAAKQDGRVSRAVDALLNQLGKNG